MIEYEKLTGSYDYSTHLKSVNAKYSKINYINILTGCYLIMRAGSAESLLLLKEIGIIYDKVTIENINKLRSKILAYKTRMEIESAIDKSIKEDKMSYEDIISNLEMALERNINENMSVAKYISIVRSINKKNESISNHGRKS